MQVQYLKPVYFFFFFYCIFSHLTKSLVVPFDEKYCLVIAKENAEIIVGLRTCNVASIVFCATAIQFRGDFRLLERMRCFKGK